MAWDLAENLKSLRTGVRRWRPRVVIYTIGDDAHKRRTSDHNVDDLAGSAAEQSDGDARQEVKALDVMLGAGFSHADALLLIAVLVADPASRKRLRYIIFDHRIWSAKNNWVPVAFESDPHTDHVHISNDTDDDANAAPWPAVLALSGGTVAALDAQDLLNVRIQAGLAMYDMFWSMAKGVDVKASDGTVIADWDARAKPTRDNMLAVLVAPILKSIADTDTANDKARDMLDVVNDTAADARHDAEMAALTAVPSLVADAVIDMPTDDLIDVLRDGLGDGWADFKAAVAAS